MLRGQSAIEYLGNHGWALIAILLVFVAVFFYFNSVHSRFSEVCDFPIGLRCESFYLHENGTIEVEVFNGLRDYITIDKVACVVDKGDEVPGSLDAVGKIRIFPGRVERLSLECKDPSGAVVSGSTGDKMWGSLFVHFYDEYGQSRMEKARLLVVFNP